MSAEDGRKRIEWAARTMPVLREIRTRLAGERRLSDLRIAVSLLLEPKTANLALALQAAGADVGVHAGAHSTDDDVAQALRVQGVQVFAESGASAKRVGELSRACLQWGPDIILDDSATLIRLAHREYPDLVATMLGAAEETTSGVRPLRAMHEDGHLRIPVIAVNDARTKFMFDNLYGTGQSCVMAFLDVTNLQLAGRTVVVVGYGWVGQGVARHAAALGAHVVVAEIDAVLALRAHYDGHRVMSLTDAAPIAEVVFAATGLAGAVTAEHLNHLPDGAILCTAGGGAFELPMTYLNSLNTAAPTRESVIEYVLPHGNRVRVIGDGNSLNCSEGEGNPIEVMDLSLSLQALAAEQLARDARTWTPGIRLLDPEIETAVAEIRLRHEGCSLEPVTPALAAARRVW